MSTPAPVQRQFPCTNCGAALFWDPGTTSLKCPYCGTENHVAPAVNAEPVRELDFLAHLRRSADRAETVEAMLVRCDGCGAEQTLAPGRTADTCTFCGAGIVAQAVCTRSIKPAAVLPFAVPKERACDAFSKWLGSLWFAPGDLKRVARRDGLRGAYVPAWTYDSRADTRYTGQRGDDYWTTETYTAHENGRSVTRTRQVRRTRWRHAAGRVHNAFDDVLVLAVRNLPPKASALEPWDLHALVPYDDGYLSGFVAERYQVDLPTGFELAKGQMAPVIDQTIRRDIGGDHQRVDSADTAYFDVTFKHVLLPMWISAYRYQGKVFTFLVNARTGEVQGDRPYSVWKILLAVLLVAAVAVGIWVLASSQR
jgi:DNA-directed RNA polymerase subunit RPC12/RpoP